MAAVERALVHRFEQLESRDHGAGGQHFDLELAPGHVVDLLGEVLGVLVEDVLRGPGALEAQRRGLRGRNHRHRHGASRNGRAFQHAAA
ncbi:hypothetical protein FQZ97_1188410 [compost metagenome]